MTAIKNDLQAIRDARLVADLDSLSASQWHTFLEQAEAQGNFALADLEELIATTCQSQTPSASVCALLLETLRLAPAAYTHIPEGAWLAHAQGLALDFLQAGRYNADSRRVLWDMAFSALAHQIRPLHTAPELDRLAGILGAYPFVLADEYLVPSLLSPLLDAWAGRPDLLEQVAEAYGHFPAVARKIARMQR